jgi:aminoglycoside 3-N-acetyltransferase
MGAPLRNRAKSALVTYAPRPVTSRLRAAKRRVRRVRYERDQRRNPVLVDRAALVDGFRRAGLRDGDGVFFQSAMSRFGRIDGGPVAVLAALEEVLGPQGTIAMPAFSMVGETTEYPRSGTVFDAAETPSLMGAITEHFRKQPGVVRSLHPTHSVAARGPGAEELVAGHHVAPTPFGDDTPFGRMVDRGFVQVWFGCDVGPFTLYHTFECRRGDFPLDVFAEWRMEAVCVDADGVSHPMSTLVHDPVLARTRIDNNPAVEARFHSLLLEAGALRSATVGRGEILTVQMPRLMDEMERLLAAGTTIYDVELPRWTLSASAG